VNTSPPRLDAFGDRRAEVNMPKLQTEFYDRASGCYFRVTWANGQHYREGTAFLRRLTGGNYVQRPDGVDHYIMETPQQREAALAFKRKLEGRGKP
jgi:hypothetical protein